MRHRRGTILSCMLATLAGSPVAAAQDELVFVPIASDIRTNEQDVQGQLSWQSHTYIRNFGSTEASYEAVSFFAGACGPATIKVPPDSAVRLCGFSRRESLEFGAVRLSPGLVISSEMQRVENRYGCRADAPFDPDTVVLGRVPLPTFRGLFPAGSTAVTNHIDLGGIGLAGGVCSELPRELYRRRVNLTLANGGTEAAVFEVRFHSLRAGMVDSKVFELGPREVRQFNGIQPGALSGNSARDGDSEFVWMSVSSDQPFVGYASSVFDNGGPRTMPMEVFPLRLP